MVGWSLNEQNDYVFGCVVGWETSGEVAWMVGCLTDWLIELPTRRSLIGSTSLYSHRHRYKVFRFRIMDSLIRINLNLFTYLWFVTSNT
jgi:hypothetical protein